MWKSNIAAKWSKKITRTSRKKSRSKVKRFLKLEPLEATFKRSDSLTNTLCLKMSQIKDKKPPRLYRPF